MLIHEIFAHVLGDIVFFVFLFILAFAWFQRKRRNLVRFFGLKRQERLVVYLSSLNVRHGSIEDRLGDPSDDYTISVPSREFQVIPELTRLFATSWQDLAPAILGGGDWHTKSVSLDFRPSPHKGKVRGPMLIVGGPRYNAVSDYYFEHHQPSFVLKKCDDGRWVVRKVRGALGTVEPTNDDSELGILVRTFDEHHTSVIIAAGITEIGTIAAVRFLVTRWHELQNRFGDKEFGICVRCASADVDPAGYLSPNEFDSYGLPRDERTFTRQADSSS